MDFLAEVAVWFTDRANWSGPDGVPIRIGEHLLLAGIPLLLALVVALPIGLWVGHTRHGADVAINVSNVGRAIPSLALLAIAAMLLNRPLVDLGLRREAAEAATIVAMLALAIPPILTNAYVAISQVDGDLIEAGRGMGMREMEILRTVELPVGMPVVLAGIRTSAVQVVATATLGAVFATGGLGRYIIDGIAQRKYEEVFAGALLVALLSIGTEVVFARIQRRAVSPGLMRPEGPATSTEMGAVPNS